MPVTFNQAEFTACLFDPSTAVPAGVTTAHGAPDSKRFDVYRNNVIVALIGALEQRFPVTRRLVGGEFFRGMARVFIGVSKPASPLIFQYGDDFPGFIAAFDPARPVPYLGDVARLEAFWSRAYHAVDAAPLELAALAAIEPEALHLTKLVPHPSAALISSPWPVGSIWEAHQHASIASSAHAGPQTILVVRPEADVNVHILPPQDTLFAESLFARMTLGAAAEAAARDKDFEFGTALVGLVSLAAFLSIELIAERHPS